jgi:hypothetical protein
VLRELWQFLQVLVTSGNAVATICGSFNPCPSCANLGKDLNSVLAQYNILNEVQGVYMPASNQFFFLTTPSEAS